MKTWIVVALCLAALVGACAPYAAPAATPTTAPGAAPGKAAGEAVTVRIVNFSFQPAEVKVRKGQAVTWVNEDDVRHSATGASFDTGLIGKGESRSHKFDQAGTFDYHCTPHTQMRGKVVVE